MDGVGERESGMKSESKVRLTVHAAIISKTALELLVDDCISSAFITLQGIKREVARLEVVLGGLKQEQEVIERENRAMKEFVKGTK